MLQLDRVGIHENLFDLGEHSLLAFKVLARVAKEFKIELPRLFEALACWPDWKSRAMSNKIDNTAGKASALSPQTRDRPKAINGGEKTGAMTSAEIHAPVAGANRKKYCALQEIENRHDSAAAAHASSPLS